MTHRSINGFGNGATSFYKEHNDSLVDGLSKKVSKLKEVTIAIGDDVREQNRLLDQMDTDFDSSRGILGTAMRRLGIVSKSDSKSSTCGFIHIL